MKPEVRIKLLKEYETIKMKSEPGSIWWSIIAMVFFGYMFVSCVLMAAKESYPGNRFVFIVICCLPLLALVWQAFIVAKKYYDKKVLLFLQAILDKTEEKIYEEISDLDIQSKEKEENVI